MKTWYYAKCDACKEVKYVLVSNPTCTTFYLNDQEVQDFLSRHYGCELSLGWRDDQMDKLWEEGYLNKDLAHKGPDNV